MNLNNIHKIGGEFEIDPSYLKGISSYEPKSDLFFYSSGRSALMAILGHISETNPKTIHIPYYICQSVVDTCTLAGFKIQFYEIYDSFLLPVEYIDKVKRNETLLTVNYFGFVEDNISIKTIKGKRPDIITISDQTQSFWTYKNSHADYSFTSLRKQFPVPDGALIHTSDASQINKDSIEVNTFHQPKLLGSILKWYKSDDELYLHFFEEGEQILDNKDQIQKASKVSQYIFENLNFEEIKQQRKENAQLIYELGKKSGLNFVFELGDNTIPLNIPILLQNRDAVRKSLMKENIFLPIHWSLERFNSNSEKAKFIANQELSLIVDQRYSKNDILRQIETLNKNIHEH